MQTRRRRNPIAAALEKYAAEATVACTEPVTPSMQRIRLVADEPVAFAYTPGQHVRVQINDPLSLAGILRPGETLRTYTIWEFQPEEQAIELRVHLYDGDGIGLRWARRAGTGDRVRFWWPKSDFTPVEDAPYHVFAGEETASAAFGPMIRALGPAALVLGVLESAGPEHDLPVPAPHELSRVHRNGSAAASSETLLAGVAGLDLPREPGAAYVAGEARTCQMVRDFLVRERGWPRRSIMVKPFWTPGKRGLH